MDSVKWQLETFQRAGVLNSIRHGRAVLVSFDPKSCPASGLKEFVAAYCDKKFLETKEQVIAVRRRHRSKDKPIIHRET